MTCCFFGHKDAPESVSRPLEKTIEKLIIEQGVNSFLVGNQGHFDSMVITALRKMKTQYPAISYNVVLAYMPTMGSGEWFPYHYEETMLPEGIESAPPRFAISWRNKWMVKEADIVVCYITHSWGGAAQFVESAAKKGKPIINLAETPQ